MFDRRNGAQTQVFVPPPALRDGLACVVHHVADACDPTSRRAFTYGTATSNMAIAWYWRGRPESLDAWAPDDHTAPRTPIDVPIRIVGGCTRPWIHYSPEPFEVLIAVFRPDAMREWLGLQPLAWMDQAAGLDDLESQPRWCGLARAVLAAGQPAAAVPLLYEGLLALRPKQPLSQNVPTTTVQWLNRLTSAGQRGSQRTAQRKLKQRIGLSERHVRKLARLEAAAIEAANRIVVHGPQGLLAGVAADAGFYDQPQLSRDGRDATGFTAKQFLQRSLSDDSFWLIRAYYSLHLKSLLSSPSQLLQVHQR